VTATHKLCLENKRYIHYSVSKAPIQFTT